MIIFFLKTLCGQWLASVFENTRVEFLSLSTTNCENLKYHTSDNAVLDFNILRCSNECVPYFCSKIKQSETEEVEEINRQLERNITAAPRESWKNTGCFSYIMNHVSEKELVSKMLG
jgi:hypothetical protein